jgi:hypothetical protein
VSMRYPVERMEYNKIVGKTRVENIAQTLRELGFSVVTKKPENHDVDMWVFKNEKLVLVIEVLNWRNTDYMDEDSWLSVVKNFRNPQYESIAKLLVYSFYSNIKNQMSNLEKRGIDFLELGFQTQPPDFYKFYEKVAAIYGMKPDGKETEKLLRENLLYYLKNRNLL